MSIAAQGFPGGRVTNLKGGRQAFPNFTYITNNPGGIANLGSYVAPALVDIDADGDFVLFTGELYDNIYFYRKDRRCSYGR